jgi:hypothetical protein
MRANPRSGTSTGWRGRVGLKFGAVRRAGRMTGWGLPVGDRGRRGIEGWLSWTVRPTGLRRRWGRRCGPLRGCCEPEAQLGAQHGGDERTGVRAQGAQPDFGAWVANKQQRERVLCFFIKGFKQLNSNIDLNSTKQK